MLLSHSASAKARHAFELGPTRVLVQQGEGGLQAGRASHHGVWGQQVTRRG